MKLKHFAVVAFVAPLLSGAAFAADPPKQDDEWRGSLGAGLSITQSTTDSLSVNFTGDAVRATVADQWDLAGAVLYGSSKDAAGVRTTIRHEVRVT